MKSKDICFDGLLPTDMLYDSINTFHTVSHARDMTEMTTKWWYIFHMWINWRLYFSSKHSLMPVRSSRTALRIAFVDLKHGQLRIAHRRYTSQEQFLITKRHHIIILMQRNDNNVLQLKDKRHYCLIIKLRQTDIKRCFWRQLFTLFSFH